MQARQTSRYRSGIVWSTHGIGNEHHIRHFGSEFQKAAWHVIEAGHDDEAVIAMRVGPGRGLMRIAAVEDAQKKIMRIARKLSDSGDLVLGGGEDFV